MLARHAQRCGYRVPDVIDDLAGSSSEPPWTTISVHGGVASAVRPSNRMRGQRRVAAPANPSSPGPGGRL